MRAQTENRRSFSFQFGVQPVKLLALAPATLFTQQTKQFVKLLALSARAHLKTKNQTGCVVPHNAWMSGSSTLPLRPCTCPCPPRYLLLAPTKPLSVGLWLAAECLQPVCLLSPLSRRSLPLTPHLVLHQQALCLLSNHAFEQDMAL